MLKLVCEENKCTACEACLNICPEGCISFKEDEYAVKKAYIDTERCIKCNLCSNVCPRITKIAGYTPTSCYAAWSLDEKIRYKSASGGIATELYQYAIDNGYWIAGVCMNAECDAIYSLTNKNGFNFQNSKYTFPNMGNIYVDISSKLKAHEKVLFIGLPCQVAALKSYLKTKKFEETNILFVDLICHGITPANYLKQHIKQIEHKKGKQGLQINFRDPKYGTHKYYFTLANNDTVFYKKNVKQDDEFQIAYHRGIAYRENCYFCQWAGRERLGDITLSDFPGLGSKEKCAFTDRNVSCVMINTPKGRKLYSELLDKNRIYSEKRPLEENFDFQPTLNNITPQPPERRKFLILYRQTKDFDYSIQKAASKIIWSNRLNSLTRYRDARVICRKLIPRTCKDKVKRIIKM